MHTFICILLAASCASVLSTFIGCLIDDLFDLESNWFAYVNVSLWLIGTIGFSIAFLN